ncbi:response regulator [Microvirga massiliensis]|uniref:response regulator n=1 Tax=Microvirga massiliensis TaxID=1033741 RepID=UPI00062BAEA7|nr:response regulator [Microvirga massiliensis]
MGQIDTPEPRVTVLVVEDETLLRVYASDFLEDAGFKVFEAMSADEAVAILQVRLDVRVVMTDVALPGAMSGFDLARVVRERWPGVGVIAISGHEGPLLGELPADVPFITKPYQPSTIVSLVRQMAMAPTADKGAQNVH